MPSNAEETADSVDSLTVDDATTGVFEADSRSAEASTGDGDTASVATETVATSPSATRGTDTGVGRTDGLTAGDVGDAVSAPVTFGALCLASVDAAGTLVCWGFSLPDDFFEPDERPGDAAAGDADAAIDGPVAPPPASDDPPPAWLAAGPLEEDESEEPDEEPPEDEPLDDVEPPAPVDPALPPPSA